MCKEQWGKLIFDSLLFYQLEQGKVEVVFVINACFFLLMFSSSPSAWCRDHYIHWRALKLAYNIHRQLCGILQRQVITIGRLYSHDAPGHA